MYIFAYCEFTIIIYIHTRIRVRSARCTSIKRNGQNWKMASRQTLPIQSASITEYRPRADSEGCTRGCWALVDNHRQPSPSTSSVADVAATHILCKSAVYLFERKWNAIHLYDREHTSFALCGAWYVEAAAFSNVDFSHYALDLCCRFILQIRCFLRIFFHGFRIGISCVRVFFNAEILKIAKHTSHIAQNKQ